MDKTVLYDYKDACEFIQDTEKEIERLEKKKRVVRDKVHGSNPEFPYEERSFSLIGTAENPGDCSTLERERKLLADQQKEAQRLKLQVEAWMKEIPFRMRRIVKLRFFQRLSWEEVADQINAKSGESIRGEFNRFMNGAE